MTINVESLSISRLWTQNKRHEIFAMENIYFSDCIMRNKDDYRFLAHFDPDELPVMMRHRTLPDLMAYLYGS